MEKVLLAELETQRACAAVTSPAMRAELAEVCAEVKSPSCVTTAAAGFPEFPMAPSGTPCSFPFRLPFQQQETTKCITMFPSKVPWCVTDTDENGEVTRIGFCDLNKCEVDWGSGGQQ